MTKQTDSREAEALIKAKAEAQKIDDNFVNCIYNLCDCTEVELGHCGIPSPSAGWEWLMRTARNNKKDRNRIFEKFEKQFPH
jgi:hypothetical protein